MLGNPQLLNLAMKYASKQNRRLAEKLMEIAPLMQNSDNDVSVTFKYFDDIFSWRNT